MSRAKERPAEAAADTAGESLETAAAPVYAAGKPPGLGNIARLRRTAATGFYGGNRAPMLYVAEGVAADDALSLAFGCLDYVRERLHEVTGADEPMSAAETWALALLVDTALAAYSACGAEG